MSTKQALQDFAKQRLYMEAWKRQHMNPHMEKIYTEADTAIKRVFDVLQRELAEGTHGFEVARLSEGEQYRGGFQNDGVTFHIRSSNPGLVVIAHKQMRADNDKLLRKIRLVLTQPQDELGRREYRDFYSVEFDLMPPPAPELTFGWKTKDGFISDEQVAGSIVQTLIDWAMGELKRNYMLS